MDVIDVREWDENRGKFLIWQREEKLCKRFVLQWMEFFLMDNEHRNKKRDHTGILVFCMMFGTDVEMKRSYRFSSYQIVVWGLQELHSD